VKPCCLALTASPTAMVCITEGRTTRFSFTPSTFSPLMATTFGSCGCISASPNLARLLARRADGIHPTPFEQDEIGQDLFKAACDMMLEGLVSKRRDSWYRASPSRDWIKVKNPASSGRRVPSVDAAQSSTITAPIIAMGRIPATRTSQNNGSLKISRPWCMAMTSSSRGLSQDRMRWFLTIHRPLRPGTRGIDHASPVLNRRDVDFRLKTNARSGRAVVLSVIV
jgi:hypothetical protein